MSIVTHTMVVNIQIGTWTGHKLDKGATADLTERHGAASDAARVNTHIVPKEVLAPITTAAGALRQHFYHNTLPWRDNGDRLLPKAMYEEFMQGHGARRDQFQSAVEDFLVSGYPGAREQAAFRMGALFKAEVFPDIETLRPRFYARVEIDPVTTAGDFRVDMDQEAAAHIRDAMEEAMQERVGRAVSDIWARLSAILGNYHERMNEPNKRFKAATVTNLEELVDMIPKMNILNDPDLARIQASIKDTIIGFSAEDLRGDHQIRARVAKQSRQILDDMSGIMRAFKAAA